MRFGRRMSGIAVLTGLALALVPLPVRAQEETKPYDAQLLRLSEILGAVHYLRALCGTDEGQAWRVEMESLIAAEGTSALRKVKFTQSFNKGYRSYQRTYRSCTASAETAVERFLKEGAEIAEALAKEYE